MSLRVWFYWKYITPGVDVQLVCLQRTRDNTNTPSRAISCDLSTWVLLWRHLQTRVSRWSGILTSKEDTLPKLKFGHTDRMRGMTHFLEKWKPCKPLGSEILARRGAAGTNINGEKGVTGRRSTDTQGMLVYFGRAAVNWNILWECGASWEEEK